MSDKKENKDIKREGEAGASGAKTPDNDGAPPVPIRKGRKGKHQSPYEIYEVDGQIFIGRGPNCPAEDLVKSDTLTNTKLLGVDDSFDARQYKYRPLPEEAPLYPQGPSANLARLLSRLDHVKVK